MKELLKQYLETQTAFEHLHIVEHQLEQNLKHFENEIEKSLKERCKPVEIKEGRKEMIEKYEGYEVVFYIYEDQTFEIKEIKEIKS